MLASVEKEFKVLLTKQQYNTLTKKVYPHIKAFNQKNVYYDTLNNDLSNNKIALRIRYLNNRKIVTLKYYKNDELIEMEKEVICENPFQDDANVRETLKQFNIDPFQLQPVVTINTKRTLIKGIYAEIAIDKNTFDNGDVDYEIEYEVLKKHNDIELFNNILKDINITYTQNCDSKIKRALKKRGT